MTVRPVLLLVEDDSDTRKMYAEYLSGSFDVFQAADGREALTFLETRVPALVITDHTLPGIDGFEMTRQMRARDSTRQVPVICLSGHGGRAHEERAREAGCNLVLEKPCAPEAIARAAWELTARASL